MMRVNHLSAYCSTAIKGGLVVFLFISLTVCKPDNGRKSSRRIPKKDRVKSDERVELFSSAGWLSDDGETWHLPVHAWIYEPEKGSFARNQVAEVFEEAIEEDDLSEEEERRLRRRVRPFLADNEGGKELTIEIAGKQFLLPESDGDGHVDTVLELSKERVQEHANQGRITYRVITGAANDNTYSGSIHLMRPTGLTVISDIDDTIKISNVTNHRKLLQNTFLKPFRPVSGMSERYKAWRSEHRADVIYLSNSPWQLYPHLEPFLNKHDFPAGPVDLLRVQFDDFRIRNLFASSEEKKTPRILTYIKRYPERQFVLVGDAGEKDPEIYGEIARRYPDRVDGILIHNVTDEDPSSERFRNAFRDVPAKKWNLFDDPSSVSLPD